MPMRFMACIPDALRYLRLLHVRNKKWTASSEMFLH